MIVRCGKCRAELEVSGPGEFICPSCGTRNAVRGAPGPAPYGMNQSGSGLTLPGGMPAPPSRPPAAPSDVGWVTCDTCRYRFAVGTVENIKCPNCGSDVEHQADAQLPSP